MSNEYRDWLADRKSFWKNEEEIMAFYKEYFDICKKYGRCFLFDEKEPLYLDAYCEGYEDKVMEDLEDTLSFWRNRR